MWLQAVLSKVARQALLLVAFAAHAPSIDIAAPANGPKVRAGNRKRARADKGIVKEFSRRRVGNIRSDEGELGVHAGGGDVLALLEVVSVDDVAGRVGDEATQADAVRELNLERHAVEGPELKDGECVVWLGHADGPVKGEVAEGVDEGEALFVGVRALVGVYDELEGCFLVLGPEMGCLCFDGFVESLEGWACSPELVY